MTKDLRGISTALLARIRTPLFFQTKLISMQRSAQGKHLLSDRFLVMVIHFVHLLHGRLHLVIDDPLNLIQH
jgi:hypothetical protein